MANRLQISFFLLLDLHAFIYSSFHLWTKKNEEKENISRVLKTATRVATFLCCKRLFLFSSVSNDDNNISKFVVLWLFIWNLYPSQLTHVTFLSCNNVSLGVLNEISRTWIFSCYIGLQWWWWWRREEAAR